MSEFQDPLRSLFQQAAGTGQDHAVTAPVDRIAARGRRARRRRIGALVTVACLAFGGGAAVALLPGSSAPVGPAVTPRPSPDRMPSPVPTEPGSSTLPTPESTGSVSPSDTAPETGTAPPSSTASRTVTAPPSNTAQGTATSPP